MAEAEFPAAKAASERTGPDGRLSRAGEPMTGAGAGARPGAARAVNGRAPLANNRWSYGLASPPPDPAEALYYEGMAAYQHRNWEQALERFSRLKTLQPTRPGLDALLDEVQWFLQLQAATPTGSADVINTSPRRSLREQLQSMRARGGLWRVWVPGLLGFVAVALLLTVLQVGVPEWVTRFWPGSILGKGASKPDAAELLDRGEARLAAGDYEGAQEAFRQLLKIAPDDPETRVRLARAAQAQTLAQDYVAAEAAIVEEDWERAAGELEKILAVAPDYADAQARADFVAQRRHLAGLYADGDHLSDLGQWRAAAERFEKIKELDSSYRTEAVADFLFHCYLNAGRVSVEGTANGLPMEDLAAVERAVGFFSRALGIQPRNRMALEARRLGGVYLEALRFLARDDRAEALMRLDALVAEMQSSEVPGFGQDQIARQFYNLLVSDADVAAQRGDVSTAIALYRRAQVQPVDDNSRAVQGEMLVRSFTPTPTPRPTHTPSPMPPPRPLAVVPEEPISARAGPGDNYPEVGQLAAGSELEITGRHADGLWLRICCVTPPDGGHAREGWLAATLVEVRGDANSVEVVIPPPPLMVPAAPTPTATLPAQVCIGGQLRDAKGAAPLPGWSVILEGSDVWASTRTDASGNYWFYNLAPGSYAVRQELDGGWQSISPNPTMLILAPSAACVVVDFWNERTAPPPLPLR